MPWRRPAAMVEAVVLPAAAEAAVAVFAGTLSALKNIVLFFAAPFIGLAYVVAFPFVGLGVFAVLAGRVAARFEAVRTFGLVLRPCVMVIAAPFIGLVFVVFFPFIGLVMLAWIEGRAVLEPVRNEELVDRI